MKTTVQFNFEIDEDDAHSGLLGIEATVYGFAGSYDEPAYTEVEILKATLEGEDVLDWLLSNDLLEAVEDAAIEDAAETARADAARAAGCYDY